MLPRIAYRTVVAFRDASLSAQELQSLRDRKTRRTVRYCYDYVPYYREKFRAEGLTPEDIRGMADLRRISPVTRTDIVRNFPDRITAKGAKVGMVKSTSGTTTGTPMKVWCGPDFADAVVAQHIRRVFRMGLRPWEKVALIETAGGATSGSSIAADSGRLKAARTLLTGSFNMIFPTLRQLKVGLGRTNSAEVADALFEFQPDLLYARAAHARRIGRLLRESGRRISPRFVVCAGDFMSNAARSDVADYFGCDVYDSYGCREMSGVASECYLHDGLHVNADNCLHEVVEDGEPVGTGESGNLLLTSFENFAMPLLRYEIGDSAVQGKDEKCGCGLVFPRIQAVLGRKTDGLLASDGTVVPPGTICDELESKLSLRDFQVIQRSPGAILVKVQCADNNAETARKLRSALGSQLDAPQDVRLESWAYEDMPPKYRPVVSSLIGN